MKKNDRSFDNFDEFAEDYRGRHNKAIALSGADSDFFSEYKIIELLRFEVAAQPLRVLDFGCGDGNSAVYLRKHFPASTILGVDVSAASIALAQKRNISNADFRAFDGFRIPFSDEEFDVVFTSMVFHHVEHRLHGGLLEDIGRILKLHGRFYSFEHNPINPLTRKVVRECEFDRDAVLLRPAYHRSIVSSSGLAVEQINYTIFFPRHLFLKPFHACERMLRWLPLGAQYFIRAVKQ